MHYSYLSRSARVRVIAVFVMLAAIFNLILPARSAALTQPDPVDGTSAMLMDAETGYIMFSQNADEQIIPASTTKVMTAMLVIEAAQRGEISLDDEITAKKSVIDGVIWDASKVLPYIQEGEVMTVRQYLYCVLLSSCCVSCDILADYVCGSVDNFVALMNQRAQELGCTNTNFMNSHGYPTEGHFTTAHSLCLIARQAIQYPEFCEIFGCIKTTIPATNLSPERKLYNTCWITWDPEKITSIYCKYYYPYATGGKTGSSKKSGHCLISTAEKDGRTLICAVTGTNIQNMGTEEDSNWQNMSFTETSRLYEWGFNNFSIREVAYQGTNVGNIAVTESKTKEVSVLTANGASALLPNDYDTANVFSEVSYKGAELEAPVSAGDVVGTMTLSADGRVIASIPLVAGESAELKTSNFNPLLIALLMFVIAVAGVLLYLVNTDRYAVGKTISNKLTPKPLPNNAARNGAKRSGNAQRRPLSPQELARQQEMRRRFAEQKSANRVVIQIPAEKRSSGNNDRYGR